MLKNSTWSAALFLIITLASTLGVVYSGTAAAQNQCTQLADIESYEPYYTNDGRIHAIDISLNNLPDVIIGEVTFNGSTPNVGNVQINTLTSNNFVDAPISTGLPTLYFDDLQVDVISIRVYLSTPTTSSINSVRVFSTCAGSGIINQPTSQSGPTGPIDDPTNECSSSNISAIRINGNTQTWPLQSPIDVPLAGNIRVVLKDPMNLEGFTLAWEEPIQLYGTTQSIYHSNNYSWSYPVVGGISGKHYFADQTNNFANQINNVKEIDIRISTANPGTLLGVELCSIVSDHNTLMPVDQTNQENNYVDPNAPNDGFCDKALLESTEVNNVPFGPRKLESPDPALGGVNSFQFNLDKTTTVFGFQADWIVNIPITQIQVNYNDAWQVVSFSETFDANGELKVVFDTPLLVDKIFVGIWGASGVINSARVCKDWSNLKPTAAVVIGDSFASGEGASYTNIDRGIPGTYDSVFGWTTGIAAAVGIDLAGEPGVTPASWQGFPGWRASNKNAYFCHRSKNASLMQANLAVDDRFNLACSGAWPTDISGRPFFRYGYRGIKTALSELSDVYQTHDIKVVQLMLGGNNSQFSFGTVLSDCIGNFFTDAFFTGSGLWFTRWFSQAAKELSQSPCTVESLGVGPTQLAAVTAEVRVAIEEVVLTMEALHGSDHEYTIVVQTYPSPVPPAFSSTWNSAPDASGPTGSTESDNKFKNLAEKRYIGGCTFHSASLATATTAAAGLNAGVEAAFDSVAASYPNVDLRLSDLSQAFNDFRLCENDDPGDDWFNGLRFMTEWGLDNGRYQTTILHYNQFDVQRIGEVCSDHLQACQESMHPNDKGHKKIAQCLNQTLALPDDQNKLSCAPGAP